MTHTHYVGLCVFNCFAWIYNRYLLLVMGNIVARHCVIMVCVFVVTLLCDILFF